jgi:hypothetical protein
MDKVSLQRGSEDGAERRSDQRRRVLLSGKLSDLTASKVAECAISNLSPAGAQVRLYSEMVFPNEVYLIDAKTHSAHLAEVIWRGDDRLGLRFATTYDLDNQLPVRLKFLQLLFVETKLRQIELLETRGLTLDEALEAVGGTRTAYERWRRDDLLNQKRRGTARNAAGVQSFAKPRDE